MLSRKSFRLKDYDYRQNGVYFVTVCAYGHANIFGAIDDGVMMLNDIGKIVAEEWQRTADLRANVDLDASVVMPNHLHGIIMIRNEDDITSVQGPRTDSVNRNSAKLQAGSLGAIIGRFKGKVSRRVHEVSIYRDIQVWQRNYYDHIIRNERSLRAIREYIAFNPSRWPEDSLYIESGLNLAQC